MTSPDVPGLQRLKPRTGNVLCPQLCWLIHKTAGQDVFLEYRRPAKDSWLAPACLLSFCYLFATILLLFCYLQSLVVFGLLSFWYLFGSFLLSDCYHSLFALHKQGTLAMYTSPRRKGAPSESRSSLRADHPRLNPTPLAINPAMPDGLASASRPHSKLRTRSPLSGGLMMAFRAPAGF